MSNFSSDITILGGGVIGLLTALEFIQTGFSVTLIEKNQIGQESSWAGGGILLPLYPWRQAEAITHLVIPSLKYYPLLANQLIEGTGIDPEWTVSGLLITKNPDIDQAKLWCKNNAMTFMPAGASFFEHLVTQSEQPLWLPEIAQARNPRLVKSLRQMLVNEGVDLIEHCNIQAIHSHHQRVNSIATSVGRFAVNQLIVCTGAWSGQLFQQLFTQVMHGLPDIFPARGQMLLFDAEPDILKYIVLDGERYLIPRRDGKLLVGSTVEYDGFNKITTELAREQLYDFALRLLPALKNYSVIAHWAGLRPGSRSGIPYIDRHPEIDNVYLNAGHFRNGLAMGPASAKLIVDLVLGRAIDIDPVPYQFMIDH